MKNLLLVFLFIGSANITYCQNQIANDRIFRRTFSKTELEDLQLLFDFFNQTICDSNEVLEDCYQAYFIRLNEAAEEGVMYLHIPFEEQQEVYKKLSDSTFREIWVFGEAWFQETPDHILRTIYFNANGDFMRFLKKASRKDAFINVCYESAKLTGMPGATVVAEIYRNNNMFDIEDVKVKFVIAVMNLTLNDQYKRKEMIRPDDRSKIKSKE